MAMDVGLRAKLQPELDERAADAEVEELADRMGVAEQLEPEADTRKLERQLEQAGEDFSVGGGGFSGREYGGSGGSGMGGAGSAAGGAAAAKRGGLMKFAKGGMLTVALGGAVGLGILKGVNRVASASPAWQKTQTMFGQALDLFFRPFGNMMSTWFSPLAEDLRDMAIQFNKAYNADGLPAAIMSLPKNFLENISPQGAGAAGGALAGAAAGGWAGFKVGAAGGAAIGSIIPGAGTAAGGAIGGLLGAGVGAAGGALLGGGFGKKIGDVVDKLGGFSGIMERVNRRLDKWGLPELEWRNFLDPLSWDFWIESIKWAAYLNPLTWTTFIPMKLIWDNYLTEFSWPDIDPPSFDDLSTGLGNAVDALDGFIRWVNNTIPGVNIDTGDDESFEDERQESVYGEDYEENTDYSSGGDGGFQGGTDSPPQQGGGMGGGGPTTVPIQDNQQEQPDQVGGGGGAPGITPFAAGGLVNRPTRGLIGESGPEAVMPLADLQRALENAARVGAANASNGSDMSDEVVSMLEDIRRELSRLDASVTLEVDGRTLAKTTRRAGQRYSDSRVVSK